MARNVLVQQQLIVLLVVIISLVVIEHIVVPCHSTARVETTAIDRLLVF